MWQRNPACGGAGLPCHIKLSKGLALGRSRNLWSSGGLSISQGFPDDCSNCLLEQNFRFRFADREHLPEQASVVYT